jgi:hypothetical protein
MSRELASPGSSAVFSHGRWRARWIWTRPTPLRPGAGLDPDVDRAAARSWVLLRRTFSLARVPPRAPARATADSRYVLWVNGAEAARGPVRGHPQTLRYDVVDLAPHLRAGENVLAVLARHYGEATPWWMPSTGTYGLGGGAFLFEADLGDVGCLVSDASWRGLEPAAWTTPPPAAGIGGIAPEVCDGRELPAAWQSRELDDSAWSPAVELATHHVGWDGDHRPPSHPYGPLLPRPIPQLSGATRAGCVVAVGEAPAGSALDADPVRQAAADQRAVAAFSRLPEGPLAHAWEPTGDAARVLVVDFGEEVAGHVAISVDAPAGTRIDAQAAEAVDTDGRLVPLQQHSGFGYVCRGRDDRFETFDPIGLRYLALSVRAPAAAAVRSVEVHERLFPRRRSAAERSSGAGAPADLPFFACSDRLLETIWRVGRRTVDLCSQDAYLDCPSREQRAWVGDSVVHQMVDLTTHTDWSLAAWNVELAAMPRPDGMLPMAVAGDFASRDQSVIPDWALHWVHALRNLWRYTGPTERVARLLPVAERVLRWFEPFAGPDGLLEDVTGWVIIDWAAVSTQGKSAALNALWARGLRDYAEIARGLHSEGCARWAADRATRVEEGFELFWDEPRGVYVDHAVSGVPQRPVSQHANAAAIAAGLVPRTRVARVLAAILDSARIVHAAWLVPGRPAVVDGAGDMYAGVSYLVMGKPAPWWDVERGIVAAQPFFRYVVHDAVAAAGESDRIPALCRDWQTLLARDAATWSEVWYGGSHCHGWCATPTRDLVQQTLGVTPASPGFGVVRIAPALGDLAWARGAVPTPAGLVRVAIDSDRLEVETPLPAEVAVAGTDRTIPLSPGKHRVARAALGWPRCDETRPVHSE